MDHVIRWVAGIRCIDWWSDLVVNTAGGKNEILASQSYVR
jgi:hypothetical protein